MVTVNLVEHVQQHLRLVCAFSKYLFCLSQLEVALALDDVNCCNHILFVFFVVLQLFNQRCMLQFQLVFVFIHFITTLLSDTSNYLFVIVDVLICCFLFDFKFTDLVYKFQHFIFQSLDFILFTIQLLFILVSLTLYILLPLLLCLLLVLS